MVGSKHLFTVFTQSWNIFSLLSREWKYLTRQSKIKSWTAPSCLLARRCAWLKKIIPLIFRNNTFPAAAIIYDVACLFTPGLMMSCFEAIFVLLHYFDTLRPTSWAWLEKQRLVVLGNSSWLTSHCLQQSGTVLPRGASNFSPDLRPQLGVTFRYSRRTIDQLANRKIKFLQKVGLDFPLLSGVVWVYCAIYWNQMIYLHVWPFLNLPWQDLCLNYWKETRSNFSGFSFQSFLPLLCCGLIRLSGWPQGFRQGWLACC